MSFYTEITFESTQDKKNPFPIIAHSCCAVGDRFFVFGGHHRYNTRARLLVFDTEGMVYKIVK